jgi:sugar-specific transcriptional regulator TrmB
MINSALNHLGLPEDEAKIYLALLKAGHGSVSVLAKRSGVPRVNGYHLLDNLVRKHFARCSIKDGKKIYYAESPEVLVRQQLERLRVAEQVLPSLKQLTRTKDSETSVRSLNGIDDVKSVFDDTLNSTEEIVGYANLERLQQHLDEYFYYFAEELQRRRIRLRLLSPFTKLSKTFRSTYFKSDLKRDLFEIVYVDQQQFPFESDVYIYGNKVATFTLTSKNSFGVAIESPQFAQAYRSFFNLSWLGATTFVIG